MRIFLFCTFVARRFWTSIGDRTPDEYFPSNLQSFVNRMQFWLANVSKRADIQGMSTLDVLERNKFFALKPMALKTMKTGKKSWRRVPIKTSESMTFYVLHNYLDEIGFVAWMRVQWLHL